MWFKCRWRTTLLRNFQETLLSLYESWKKKLAVVYFVSSKIGKQTVIQITIADEITWILHKEEK